MSTNPNPARITNEMWRFWDALKALEPVSLLGGIYAWKKGYHNTRAANQQYWPGNYSVTDKEDLGGPSDKAAALDWTFPDAQQADYDTIIKYSSRLIASGKNVNDPRCNGLREFYGQADPDTYVEGYDFRYDRTATSGPSHLWHIHFSFDRDKVTNWFTFDAVLSVLRGESLSSWKLRTGQTSTPGTRLLRRTTPMMFGEDVEFVQEFIGAAWCGTADGYFGDATKRGVEWYQQMRGITVDGIVGRETWTNMGVTVKF